MTDPCRVGLPTLLVFVLVGLATLPARIGAAEPGTSDGKASPEALPLGKALRKARVSGKYEMLLRQIKVPADAAQYADFRDLGPREVTNYAGFSDLPKGHWVYVYPYWYIWRDVAATPKVKRAWGPEQATGPPDTHQAGDIQTAWASRTPDDQDEWLLLEYAEPVAAEAVLVYETYNPGALNRVTVFRLDGEEVEVWKGADPTPRNSGKGVSEIKFRVPFKTNRVRIHLESTKVPGWNEIDAVGLRDSAGTVHWAVSADASSTYAQDNNVPRLPPGRIPLPPGGVIIPVPPPPPAAAPPQPVPALPPGVKPAAGQPVPAGPAAKTAEERIRKLEEEVRELKEAVKELKEQLKKKP
jgi:hypothetical protein